MWPFKRGVPEAFSTPPTNPRVWQVISLAREIFLRNFKLPTPEATVIEEYIEDGTLTKTKSVSEGAYESHEEWEGLAGDSILAAQMFYAEVDKLDRDGDGFPDIPT